jgi:hypothetical protein
MSFYIDPFDPDLKTKIESLEQTPGYCLFIDIVGSTELKDNDLKKWILKFYNTFAKIRGDLYSKFRPIKSLGDALMFFIPEKDMKEESALSLYAGLCSIITVVDEDKKFFSDVKIAAAFCNEAYDITFLRDVPDIYGKDIDLTSRLLSVAQGNEIIMNSEFCNRVRDCYNMIGNKQQFSEVGKIIGPWPQSFKGFKD